jgi:hypothetical protein
MREERTHLTKREHADEAGDPNVDDEIGHQLTCVRPNPYDGHYSSSGCFFIVA